MTSEREALAVKEVLAMLNRMRLKGEMCDGVIASEDGAKYPVRRAIMATCSPYFRTLFTTPMRGDGGGEGSERKFVVVPGVSGYLLSIIVDFAYTRETGVNMSNVFDLFLAADQFRVEGVMMHCVEFLKSNINAQNCIGMWRFGKQYHCPDLAVTAWRFLMQHFTEVCDVSQELVNQPLEVLKEILSSDELIVDDEIEVWKCALIWIQHCSRARYELMPELLGVVRFGLLATDAFMRQVKSHPYVSENPACKPIIVKALKVMNGMTEGGSSQIANSCMSRPRFPKALLFCDGGWGRNGPTNIFEVYDYQMNSWNMIPSIDSRGARAYHRCVALGDHLYIIGGTDGHSCLNACSCFNILTKEWKYIAPMNNRRCYVSCVVLSGYIYAIGGYDGGNRLNTVERYDRTVNSWTYVSPMNKRRSDAGSCVVSNRIFVVGGFTGAYYLRGVELYDEVLNTWLEIAPMISQRSGVSCLSDGYRCYVLGGFNGTYRLATCEVYDTKLSHWMPIPDMLHARSNFACAVLNNCMYVCGGFDGDRTITSVERFSFSSGAWESVADLSLPRSAVAACVVSAVEDFIPRQRFFTKRRTRSPRSNPRKRSFQKCSSGSKVL